MADITSLFTSRPRDSIQWEIRHRVTQSWKLYKRNNNYYDDVVTIYLDLYLHENEV